MDVEASEPQARNRADRRAALRDRLGTVPGPSSTLEASVQLLQGLACERSEELLPLGKGGRGGV